jgi:peroxiredoxin
MSFAKFAQRVVLLSFAWSLTSAPVWSADLPTDPAAIRPVLIGSSVPSVDLTALDGSSVPLAHLLDGKPAVLVFYRGGWCPYCNLQLSELRKLLPDLKQHQMQMLAISPDRPAKMQETLDKAPLDYTLVSDHSAAAMSAFGIAFVVDPLTLAKYQTYGIDLEEASGHDHHALPVPSVFVVDAQGVVQFAYSNPDYRTRVPLRLVRAAVEAVALGETGRPLK